MAKYSDTIGVIGGMGSYSTLYFFGKFLELFNVEEEYERPRIIIDNYCTLPNKVKAYLSGENKEEFLNDIIESLLQLKIMGCTKSLIVCNTTHVFMDEIFKREKALSGYFIDMLECLSKKLYKDNINKVLIWTTRNTIRTGVFEKYLHKYGIEIEYDIEHNETIIYELMLAGEKNFINNHVENQYAKLCNMYNKSVSVVLGCTELSVVNGNCKKNNRLKIYDPLECVLEDILKNLK